MKKNIIFLTIIALPLFLSSCINYTNVKKTMGQKVDNMVHSKHLKTGSACTINALSLFTFGDSSIEAAIMNGEIEKVAFVDTTYEGFYFYYPFYQKGCTVVKGE